MINVADLSGQDLAYWVARANARNSKDACNILRRHYGTGQPRHCVSAEKAMRTFVTEKVGNSVPDRTHWQ